jgi:osmotically-inducible protein OsmY
MTTNAVRSSLLGATVGAGLMFILDPARGVRRRAVIRDKVSSAARRTRETARKRQRDVGNRLSGLRSRGRALFAHDAGDAAVVVERVHAALGRVTGHHRAIGVSATGGCVWLTGDVLAHEAPAILSATRHVRGVRDVIAEFKTHENASGIPALQGEVRARGVRPSALATRRWATAAASVGAFAITTALRRTRHRAVA